MERLGSYPRAVYGLRLAQLDTLLRREIAYELGNLFGVILKREVPGVQKMKVDVLEISPIRVCAGFRENDVVLAPDD